MTFKNLFFLLTITSTFTFISCQKENLNSTLNTNQFKLIEQKNNVQLFEDEQNIFTVITNIVRQNNIEVYSTDKISKLLTKNEYQTKALGKVDSVTVIDPETYEEVVKVVLTGINHDNFKSFRIADKTIKKNGEKIIRKCIAPIESVYDNNGNLRGERTSFYVALQDLKPHLKKHKLNKPVPSKNIFTWQDVLEKEHFNFEIVTR